MHDEKNITMRMKITYPKNSVNKMFCKPPLLKQFKRENENILTPEIKSPIVKSYVYGMFLLQWIIFIDKYKNIVLAI
jgi:hypothetical protein